MTDGDESNENPGFAMDPERSLRTLASQLVNGHRTLVDGQRKLAQNRRQLDALPPDQLPPGTRELFEQVQAQVEQQRRSWFEEMLPAIAAGMAVAIEVIDTSGPGPITAADELDAEVWNNKYLVWREEFAAAATWRPERAD